jgi:hypothetical protein
MGALYCEDKELSKSAPGRDWIRRKLFYLSAYGITPPIQILKRAQLEYEVGQSEKPESHDKSRNN